MYKRQNLSFKIKNTGDFKGKEVVQIYVSKINSTIDRPLKELKAFSKTKCLIQDETLELDFSIPISDLSYWSEENKTWEFESGSYSFEIGSSSRDIMLNQIIDIK